MKHLAIFLFSFAALNNTSSAVDSIVDTSSPLETIATEFGLADGPAWDGGGHLYFPDVKGGKLYRYTPKTGKVQVFLNDAGRISASFFSHGKLFLSDNGASQISVLNGKKKTPIAGQPADAKPPRRPNDLVVDQQGGIYYTLTGSGEVIWISPEGKQTVTVKDIKTPNGLILSPDGKTLYIAAYVPKEIWAYTVTGPGTVEKGRLFAKMDAGPDKGADGMTVDRAGNVYCAGPADIWIWNPEGKLLAKIKTPTRPINCVFGDQDMRSLYITGFGGLYRQRMKAYGCVPELPLSATSTNSKRPSISVPKTVSPHLNVVYGQTGARKLLADIFIPNTGKSPFPAVVVVHGGGWLNGDKAKFRALALALCQRGYVTMAIGYRLGHEAKFPAGIQDCNAAVRFLRGKAKQFHVDPQHIGAVGGSAGGHLVGLMAAAPHANKLQGDAGNQDQSSALQAAIVMAGPMQMASGSVAERSRTNPKKSNSNQWLGKTIVEDPELYQLSDAYLHLNKQTPPLLFMTGEFDHPERNAPSREKLKSLGVMTGIKVYPNGKHGCWNQLPWFNDMVKDMDLFFQDNLK
ncbi:MAG: SMP-30/gluconolactonase/LRE family protein [Planctomycetes bacterium]|nr:SMP-30/gluconolactonase/LRE family protein [Planctomycetota bacterium]MCH9779548.1 SMP-30/gluconolactonase/LRE family protein [Planctomycetota bacterium]MCH9793163.1 SMP-30/gluconolactonase/LRE family protein [Planctomycetota bacterium]